MPIPISGTTAVSSGPVPVALLTYDPLGNLLTFTDRATPFGSAKVKPSTPPPGTITRRRTLKMGPRDPLAHQKSSEQLLNDPLLNAAKKKKIGILTSGGDSSGMNAAVRAITRIALQKGCVPYAIYEGYQGLVDGGDNIKELGWEDVRGLLAVVCFHLLFSFSKFYYA